MTTTKKYNNLKWLD